MTTLCRTIHETRIKHPYKLRHDVVTWVSHFRGVLSPHANLDAFVKFVYAWGLSEPAYVNAFMEDEGVTKSSIDKVLALEASKVVKRRYRSKRAHQFGIRTPTVVLSWEPNIVRRVASSLMKFVRCPLHKREERAEECIRVGKTLWHVDEYGSAHLFRTLVWILEIKHPINRFIKMSAMSKVDYSVLKRAGIHDVPSFNKVYLVFLKSLGLPREDYLDAGELPYCFCMQHNDDPD